MNTRSKTNKAISELTELNNAQVRRNANNFTYSKKLVTNSKNKHVAVEINVNTSSTDKWIKLTDVNQMYKQLLTKYKPTQIQIQGMSPDGYKTYKSFYSDTEDIEYTTESYYNSYNSGAKGQLESALAKKDKEKRKQEEFASKFSKANDVRFVISF
jgi:hypothetical protein